MAYNKRYNPDALPAHVEPEQASVERQRSAQLDTTDNPQRRQHFSLRPGRNLHLNSSRDPHNHRRFALRPPIKATAVLNHPPTRAIAVLRHPPIKATAALHHPPIKVTAALHHSTLPATALVALPPAMDQPTAAQDLSQILHTTGKVAMEEVVGKTTAAGTIT
jgi:hypothetical protein